jgi:hypothetical protein
VSAQDAAVAAKRPGKDALALSNTTRVKDGSQSQHQGFQPMIEPGRGDVCNSTTCAAVTGISKHSQDAPTVTSRSIALETVTCCNQSVENSHRTCCALRGESCGARTRPGVITMVPVGRGARVFISRPPATKGQVQQSSSSRAAA